MEKELKHLNRGELIDIIYELKKSEQDLEAENAHLRELLEAKRIAFADAGSLADAAVAVSGVFAAAQNAADIYLDEIKKRRADTELECRRMIENAKIQAEAIASGYSGADEISHPPRDNADGLDTMPPYGKSE